MLGVYIGAIELVFEPFLLVLFQLLYGDHYASTIKGSTSLKDSNFGILVCIVTSHNLQLNRENFVC